MGIRETLLHLAKCHVVTPIDKVNGNDTFICQRFYVLALITELGLDQIKTSTNKSYI